MFVIVVASFRSCAVGGRKIERSRIEIGGGAGRGKTKNKRHRKLSVPLVLRAGLEPAQALLPKGF